MRRALSLLVVFVGGCTPVFANKISQGGPPRWASSPVEQESVAEHESDDDAEHDEHASGPRATPAQAAHVVVLESWDVGRRTEALGVVDVHDPSGSEDRALEELRERAAALGADAVLGVEFHHAEGGSEPTHLSGVAVQFCSALPSDYDVLGPVDATVGMHHQDDALRTLWRNAPSDADYLIHIHYDHGEGEGPVHLHATAIRFRSEASRNYRCRS